MNTIIFIIIIYLIISKLVKTAGSRNRPYPQPNEDNFPSTTIEYPTSSAEDDVPLSGPWNRDRGGIRQTDPANEQTIEPAPVLVEKPRQQRHHATAKCEPGIENQLQKDMNSKLEEIEERRRRRETSSAACEYRDSVPGEGHGRRSRRRKRHPLKAALYSKPDLASSILLGELIGPRGGKGGRRR